MPIFELKRGGLAPVSPTNFEAENIHERRDIQRALKERIASLDGDLMVIAEEFSDWRDSSRRIDLLCIDTAANLVVVELKRTEDGGHMELQALRYASMTFEHAVEALARQRNRAEPDLDRARSDILAFVGWDEPDEANFATNTRIVLVAADFSKELTTSVLWLRERGVDMRCVRLKPYRLDDGRMLVDVQQLIPIPEAAAFQTQLELKRSSERRGHAERHDLRFKFWEGLLARAAGTNHPHAGRQPTTDNWLSGPIGRAGFSLVYVIRKADAHVELWIARDKDAFRKLRDIRHVIESEFGDQLDWQELPGREGARIRYLLDGGYGGSVDNWPHTHDRLLNAMVKLERSFRAHVHAL